MMQGWAKRLADNSRLNGECLDWTGALNEDGYGIFMFTLNECRHSTSAHRAAYHVAFGAPPLGYVIKHKCHNPKCIRPEHLEAATQKSNMEDRVANGTSRLRGRKLGPVDVDGRKAALAAGMSARDFAEKFGIKPNAAYQWIRRNIA